MLLHENPKLFNGLLKEAALNLGIDTKYIEKDYYALTLLKQITSKDPNIVFKGGTSLSACYNIINRFSEDIDITYAFKTGRSKKRTIKNNIIDSINEIGLKLINLNEIRSTHLVNKYKCSYDTKDNVLVEFSSIATAFPIEKRNAQTLIGKYLCSINRKDLLEEYQLEEFSINTLSIKRTLIDKIFAICDYYLAETTNRQSRHLYDIYRIMKVVCLDEEILELFTKVRKERMLHDRCFSAKEEYIISDLLEKIVLTNVFKMDYKNITSLLLYEKCSYDECLVSINKLILFLRTHNI